MGASGEAQAELPSWSSGRGQTRSTARWRKAKFHDPVSNMSSREGSRCSRKCIDEYIKVWRLHAKRECRAEICEIASWSSETARSVGEDFWNCFLLYYIQGGVGLKCIRAREYRLMCPLMIFPLSLSSFPSTISLGCKNSLFSRFSSSIVIKYAMTLVIFSAEFLCPQNRSAIVNFASQAFDKSRFIFRVYYRKMSV